MSVLQDLRFAVRLLIKDRWFSLVAVTALALGIGVNATVFALVNAVLIRGLPFEDSGRLYMLGVRPPTESGSGPISYQDLAEWRAGIPAFEGLAAFLRGSMTVSDGVVAPEDTPGVWMTANGFDLLRQPTLFGRGFRTGDDAPGAERVVILGHALWQSRYRGDRGVLGKPIRVNGEPGTIIGVMQPGVKFPTNSELWVSAIPLPEHLTRRDRRPLSVFGRLKRDASVGQAQAQLDAVVTRLAKEHPTSNKELTVGVIQTFNERFNAGNVRTVFLAMMGAVGFVLLIACANVANLLLSRSAQRAREVAVRYAMGATRWRIVRQLLVESLLLAFGGGAIGLGIALVGVRLFDRAVTDVGKPYWIQFSVDGVVIGYLMAICAVTSVVFGLAPALQVARTSVGAVLKQGGRGSTGSREMRGFSSTLVVLQLALTLVLLTGAGLMVRSLVALAAIDTGIKQEHLIAMRVSLPRANYPTAEVRAQFFERLVPRVASVAGADGAAVSTSMPPFGLWGREILFDGRPDPGRGKRQDSGFVAISPSFFETVGAPLRRGRGFDARDGGKGAEVAIVSERFAARFFPGEDPIGRRIRFPDDDPEYDTPWITIVGISATIRHGNPREKEIPAVAYVPVKQIGPGGATVVVRSRLEPSSIVAAVRREVQSLDPDQPVANPQTVDQILANTTWPFRIFGTVFGLLALIALTLASVGLYAVIAYSVSTRTQEIGVRMALGADRGAVGWLVLRRGLWQLAIGLALGLAGAWAVGKYVLASVVAQISGTDPGLFVAVAVLLIAVALAACIIPARRATRLDPLAALRVE